MENSNDIIAKPKEGLVSCTLDEILFSVDMIDNPNAANTEYQKIVRGYGDFKVVQPEYITTMETIKRGENKGEEKLVKRISYPSVQVGELDLNYCSHRYELVPNSEIFKPVIEILEKNNIKFNAKFQHMNYARFYAEFQLLDHAAEIGAGDKIYPVLKVQHSYNGLTEYRITFGYFRMICSNGLIVPVQEKSQYNISLKGKHTIAIRESLTKLDNTIKFFLSQGHKPMQNFEVLGGIEVADWRERAIEVMNAAKVNVIENKKLDTVEELGKRLAIEHEQLKTNGKVTEWLLYNAINHYIHNDEFNIASPKQREDKDRAVLTVMLKDAEVFN